jgi:hypothetical protein
MKTVRCISRAISGLTQVAIPALFVDPFDDGEERPLSDEIADALLSNPNFELAAQVAAKLAPAAPATTDFNEAK